MYLLNGTWHQRWANPAGNAILVLGAGCVWGATRSLQLKKSRAGRSPLESPPTASYGIAGLEGGGGTVAAALASADAALYRAKAQGRDQAVLASTAES